MKQGYKKTKIGVIPQEWEVKKLGEVFEMSSGSTPSRANEDFWKNGNIYWVKTGDLNNSFITNTEEKISSLGLEKSNCKIYPINTILIAMYGGFNQIGRTGVLKIKASTNQAITALLPNEKINVNFVNYSLILLRNRWKKFAISSRKDPNITKSDIKQFQIPLPPLKEQQKIAEILSTWDEVIEKQESLIKEKENLKKGLMQQLLTGKVRFKEFSEEWKEVKVKDLFEITRGYVLAVKNMKTIKTDEYQYPVYSSQTKNNGLTGYYNEYLFENSITWTTDGANAGEVNFRKGKFYCTNVCGVLLNNNGYSNQCIAEILNLVTKKYVSYVGNPKLMNNTMGIIKIKIPSSIKEQQKIAEVLSTIDKEIELLKEELNELKNQKKGLMQKLLSGEVRVKV